MRRLCIGDKGAHFGRVFAARSGFDAGDDVNAPGAQGGDGLGYVFRIQAAGDHEMALARLRTFEQGIAGREPVEGLAGASDCRGGARVHHHRVHVGILHDGLGLSCGFSAEVNHAQDLKCRAEALAKSCRQIRRGVEVELNAGESRGADRGLDLFKRRIDEDANLFQRCRQMGHDSGNLRWRYATRAGREDKADSVCTGFGGEHRILQRGVAADFDPEAHRLAATPANNSASAAPGSGWRIRLSPIRNASNPALRSRAISAGVKIPLSVTRTTLAGICSTRASEVSRLTSKVRRSRLFTPMASAPVSPSAASPVSSTRLSSSVVCTSTSTSSENPQATSARCFSSALVSAGARSTMASARWARASTIWYSSTMKSLRRQGRGAAAEANSRLRKLPRSEEHTSELQSLRHLVCRLLLEKKK